MSESTPPTVWLQETVLSPAEQPVIEVVMNGLRYRCRIANWHAELSHRAVKGPKLRLTLDLMEPAAVSEGGNDK